MHLKILVLVILITIGLSTPTEGKKRRKGKKPSGNVIPTCKETDIEQLAKQLNNLRNDTKRCCTRTEDDRLHTDLVEIKNNATKARVTIEEVKSDVKEIAQMMIDEQVKNDIDGMKGDIEKIKELLEKMQSSRSQCELKETTEMQEEFMTTAMAEQTTAGNKVSPNSETTEMQEEFMTTAMAEQTTAVTYPQDCSDRPDFTGVTKIQPNVPEPISVYCSEGCVYMTRRFDGSVDFYRNWAEYQAGFGSPEGEYFMGLENLHGLLQGNDYGLEIILTNWPPESETRYAKYSIFGVSDASDKYRLTVGGYSGNAGDSLRRHDKMPFTTKDRDNDPNSENCAVKFTGAGWYHGGCHHTNLFGFYSDGPQCRSHAQCMSWYHWQLNHSHSLKKLDMKICPI